MRCPRCDTPNRADAAFCAGCGGRLGEPVVEPGAPTVVELTRQAVPDATFPRPAAQTGVLSACPSCGAAMAGGVDRCFACGYGTTVTVSRDPRAGRGIVIFTACAAVVAVVAGLVGLYLWRSGGADETATSREGDGASAGSAETVASTPTSTDAPATAIELPAATVATTPPTSVASPGSATVAPGTAPFLTLPSATLPIVPVATLPPAPPPTAAPTPTPPPPPVVVPTTAPGDLAIAGMPMSRPPCDGGFVVALGSFGPDQPGKIREVITEHPGSTYLRTTDTCTSLRWYFPDSDIPIYMVVYGPYATAWEACGVRDDVRARVPDTYVRALDNVTALGTDPC